MNLILCGPPGAGKTTVGAEVARQLDREFVDGDDWLAARWGRPVADYFAAGEEALFRAREVETYAALAERSGLVVATGGGALLNSHTRARLERGGVLVALAAPAEVLAARLDSSEVGRPLLSGDLHQRLAQVLRDREAHYASFRCHVPTAGQSLTAVAAAVIGHFEAAQGLTRFSLGPTTAYYGRGLGAGLARLCADHGLRPPYVAIADENVAPYLGTPVGLALAAPVLVMPPGEVSKNLDTVRALYAGCVAHGLERGGTILAFGGGVAGDVAGFVAATYMRGVAWVNVPTTVLAMADASLGGKVGVDLPEGKNLVGAFHPPHLVAADFDNLTTLPAMEVRCGLAEVVKSGVIGDPTLFARLAAGHMPLEAGIIRAAAVKVGTVNADPVERGERAVLNLGHTIGHAVEAASGFALRHGEAVAIGLAAEARLAERLGLAAPGLSQIVADCLVRLGLPVRAPGLDPAAIRAHMRSDKKKVAGRLRFALPRRIGEVVWGIELDQSGEGCLASIVGEMTHEHD